MFGSALLGLLGTYPLGILGPMLILAGIELARAARDMVGSSELVIALATAAFILGINTGAGFLAGCGVAVLFGIWRWGQGQWVFYHSNGKKAAENARKLGKLGRRAAELCNMLVAAGRCC